MKLFSEIERNQVPIGLSPYKIIDDADLAKIKSIFEDFNSLGGSKKSFFFTINILSCVGAMTPDEYFYIMVHEQPNMYSYFKCDGWDGLKQFKKDHDKYI